MIRQPVLALLALIGLAGALACGFVSHAPNRLLDGASLSLWRALPQALFWPLALGWAALLAIALVAPRRHLHGAAIGVALALLLLDLAGAGLAARTLAASAATPAERTLLGAGFWLMFAAASLSMLDGLQRLRAGLALRAAVIVAVVAGAALMAQSGLFDTLSLAREYANHRELYRVALLRHVWLVGAAVLAASLIGVPLGLLSQRRPRAAGAVFGSLNILQTIPSIALFALLIGPLSWLAGNLPWLRPLGISGIGAAPAIIALTLYALLPIARSTLAGLGSVPPAVREAARGMGMSRAQTLWQVELPMAWPLLLAGLRIVAVQTIGMAAVAALIGAGGLGSFVFLGLGQNAADLTLLGTLSIIALALAVDFVFQLLLALSRGGA